jgi:phosphatidylserine/phosphatidylglycerophosphate/cardiolipin synthase-like enzyme
MDVPDFVLRKSMLTPSGPFLAEPESVRKVDHQLKPVHTDVFLPELVPRNCSLVGYKPVTVPAFDVDQEIIAYCSPDSTYAVTKRMLDAATKSILIGIYDFSADYIKTLLLDAMKRKVKVKLMLDIDSKDEQALFDELVDSGVDGVPAPSCASHKVHYFSSSHEKVIVIDDEWSLIQSGNYSENSIPLNETDGGDPEHFRTGNRDTGLAIRSRKLAKFFTGILTSDMALEQNAPESIAPAAPAANAFLIERAPGKLPNDFFPSKRFPLTESLSVQPVLSPDNYMSFMPGKLKAARKSILIEQQYIRGAQEDITVLLEAIGAAQEAAEDLDVRIILGKIFGKKDLPKEQANLKLLKDTYGLVLGENIRYIDTSRFVHCHNKMVLIDGKGVLISSQNWSDSAVSKNREAGVWLTHAGICKYFAAIFESDWKTARTKLEVSGGDAVEPESLRDGGFVRVVPADYQEV